MKVVIVGGGLVGALSAIRQRQRNNEVEVYELRSDLRRQEVEQRGRSINLALSKRGIEALKACGVFERVEHLITPMYGRMLHSLDGKQEFVPYGVYKDQCINSVDRLELNRILLDEAERLGAKLTFNARLIESDLDKDQLVFNCGSSKSSSKGQKQQNKQETITTTFDLCIGADGAYSRVRQDVMKKTRMNYSQEYIEHGYLELCIDAIEGSTEGPKFAMHENSLHIWPRHEFMMIALPNKDKSFTVTLFMPFERFDKIKSEDGLLQFFRTEFPDALELMGERLLIDTFFKNPIGSLISVKCTPYNYRNTVIIGDASHAMVPFYGQGMNTGFEDVLVLDSALFGPHDYLPAESQLSTLTTSQLSTIEDRLKEYTIFRHQDASSICDLAMYNYFEMRSNVLSPTYRLRKTVESFLHKWIMPTRVIPLYTMVSFSQIRFSRVVSQWKRQTHYLNVFLGLCAGLTLLGLRKLVLHQMLLKK